MPFRQLLKLTLMFGVSAWLSACNYNIEKQSPELGGPPSSPQSPQGQNPEATLSWDRINTEILKPKCATCHSAAGGNRGGINLETHAQVIALNAAIADAVQSNFMPPRSRPQLTADERDLLLRWLAGGAQP